MKQRYYTELKCTDCGGGVLMPREPIGLPYCQDCRKIVSLPLNCVRITFDKDGDINNVIKIGGKD